MAWMQQNPKMRQPSYERMGAFGEMNHATPQRLRVDMSSSTSTPQMETPIMAANRRSFLMEQPPSSSSTASYSAAPQTIRFSPRPPPSRASRRTEKLSDVYSQSGDTIELARNITTYCSSYIPYQLSICVILSLCMLLPFFAVLGLTNLQFCHVQPLIPVWIIIQSVLFAISSVFRIFLLIPTPRRQRRQRRRNRGKMLCNAMELIFIFANFVWLILGCVWVYGSKPYVHFEEGMFEEHYCQPTLYWTAFLVCTASLIFYCSIIVILICFLLIGTCKHDDEMEDDEEFGDERMLD